MGGLIGRSGSSMPKAGEEGSSSSISKRELKKGSESGDERHRKEEDVGGAGTERTPPGSQPAQLNNGSA